MFLVVVLAVICWSAEKSGIEKVLPAASRCLAIMQTYIICISSYNTAGGNYPGNTVQVDTSVSG